MANRLASETSPYLRQHADNPVDWRPWGEEAFAAAVRDDRPIFLSVGYSACHWCHVMAHESFEDPATAAVLNAHFVCVKVDREERPDVDAVYMDAVQAMSGHGGWPMSVFLTPSGAPFYGGTYYPPQSRGGRPSFTDVCVAVEDAWRNRRGDLEAQGASLVDAIERSSVLRPSAEPPPREAAAIAAATLLRQHDRDWGGFGSAPKFPQTMSLELLLRHHVTTGDPESLDVVRRSLDAMAAGGIHDHLGGGFARYAVDRRWLVPHFEKMLYDQALLARIYLHGWAVAGAAHWRHALEGTIGYVLRDLRHPAGGFWSSEDADTAGVEGLFSTWTIPEMDAAIQDDALLTAAVAWYGVTDAGNFEGRNILHRPIDGPWETPAEIVEVNARLLSAREQRVRPALDDKVLTEWNALMIATLADAAFVCDEPAWRDAAVEAATFLCAALRDDEGRWKRSWQGARAATAREGRARHDATAADHAALVDAFCSLATATGAARWIDEACAAADALVERFEDPDAGGFFTTPHDGERLVVRAKDLLDNATPSANSSAAAALGRLAELVDAPRYAQAAAGTLRLLAPIAERHPTAVTHLLAAADRATRGGRVLVVSGDRPDLLDVARGYHPDLAVVWGEPFASPLWEGRDEPAAYLCEHFACRLPITDAAALRSALTERR